MVKGYLRVVSSRAARRAWCAVIGETRRQHVVRVVGMAAALVAAYLYVAWVDLKSDEFSDATVAAMIAGGAVTIVLAVMFLAEAIFVLPYELWKEEKERADTLLSTDVGRLVADCTTAEGVDLDKLREPMAALIDPNREYNEEWDRLSLQEDIERARKIAKADEEARAAVRRRESFFSRVGHRNIAMAEEASARPPRYDMTLNALVRRVAFESKWAAEFDPQSPVDHWQKTFWWEPLKREIFRPLVSGEIVARGVLTRRGEDADNGPTLIPAEFWRKADFAPELMLTETTINSAGNGARGEIYTEIEVTSRDVDRFWRARSAEAIAKAPSPFVEWHRDWWERQEELRVNTMLEMARQVEASRRAKEKKDEQ